jgi:hypothetical protein
VTDDPQPSSMSALVAKARATFRRRLSIPGWV